MSSSTCIYTYTYTIELLFHDVCDFPIFLSQLFIIPDLYFNGAARIETVSSRSSNIIPRMIRTFSLDRSFIRSLYYNGTILKRGEIFNLGILFCDV